MATKNSSKTQTSNLTLSANPTVVPAESKKDDGPQLDVRDGHMTEAYARMLPQIRSVPADRYLPITADPVAIVGIVLGHAPMIAGHADELERMPGMDPALPRSISDYARALFVANSRTIGTIESRSFESLIERATAVKEKFLATFDTMVTFGHMDRKAVAEVRQGTGYKDLATDLQNCIDMFQALPADVRVRTLISDADVTDAGTFSDEIMVGIGRRDAGYTADGMDPAALRQAAYTLCVRAWERIRKGIQYLRLDEGDAEEIAPTLFQRAGVSPKKPATDATTAEPTVGVPATTGNPAPTTTVGTAPVIPPAKGGGPFTS